jgi:3D (Asp-Asp-Asp) domain-containing protein
MKKQLVLLTIISSLVLSNILITHEMLQKSNENERILNQLARNKAEFNTFVRKNQLKMDVLSDVISEQKKQLKSKQNEIHKLEKQLQNAMNNSESPMPSVSRGTQNNPAIHMIATAYVSRCYGCSGITKVGIDVRNTTEYNGMKVIAVDPNVIPLHSIVKVGTKEGTFLAYAADTGGKIKGYRIDYLISTHNEQEAYTFGKQSVTVQILREGK